MLETLMSLAAVATIAAAAFGLGRPLVRALGVGEDDALAVGVWSVAAGLVAGGLALVALGMVGLLSTALIGVLTLAAGFWGLGEISRAYLIREERRRLGQVSPQPAFEEPEAKRPPRWLTRGVLLLAAVAAFASLVSAAAPPTAGDALCYHLELPKRYLLERAIVHLPDHDNSTYPLMVEMWYLWALALDGSVAAQMVHWGLGLLLALATALLAEPIVGRSWGRCAGCLMLLVPGVTNEMTAPLNDVGLAAFTTLALAAWRRAAVDDESPRWFVLAGWMLGAALGVKHLALLFAAAVGAAAVWQAWRRPDKRRKLLVGAAATAVVAMSVGGVWYLRAAWHHGNPVYPFFQEHFASPHVAAKLRPTLPADKAPLGRSPWALAAAPWQITMHPERFGGRGHQLGLLFLATLPGLLFCRRLRGIDSLLVVAAAYFVGWFLMRQNVRFLLPLAPLLCVPVVWVWIEMRRLPAAPAAIATVLSIAIACVGPAAAAARSRDCLSVACGLESREDYLHRREPTYAAACAANALLGPQAHILSQEQRAFYINARVTRENIYRRRTGYDRQIASPDELSRTLRAAGFTHLLLAESSGGAGIRYNGTLSRLADIPATPQPDAPFDVLVDYQFQDDDQAVRRYRLVALKLR
ncbi:MAG TPA: phospholipid carrier-dependent glycosyltransferase [Pirellulales bacterium]|nr:phospholipid carrier-dependent glycosyltransferase [Pirellulales bacterium]